MTTERNILRWKAFFEIVIAVAIILVSLGFAAAMHSGF
jgi:hypothetical protein